MHFWSLHFGPILDLVPKLILLLGQSLISKNCFYFGPYRQHSNKKNLRWQLEFIGGMLEVDVANKITLINTTSTSMSAF